MQRLTIADAEWRLVPVSGPVAVTQTKLKLSFITGAKEERGFERKQPSTSPLLKLTVFKSYQLKKKLNINIGENLNYKLFLKHNLPQ